MRDGRKLARKTKQYAAEFRGRSWFHLLTTLGVLLGLVAVIFSDLSWFVRVPASVLLALTHVRMFIIFHDYQHGAIFTDSKVAGGLLSAYGLVSLTPSSIWKHTHDSHHLDNARTFGLSAVGTFPVFTIQEYREADRMTRLNYRIQRHWLTIALGYLTVFFYSFCLAPFLANPRKHLDSGLAVVLHIGLIVGLSMVGLEVLVLALLFPMLIASALGSYLFYAQHNCPGVKLRPGAEWDHIYAALNSSTFMRMHPVMHWFTGNIGYHHIHHLNHKIPFYRLPEAMAGEKELQVPVTTTLSPREILRCLRLQLWDLQKDCFVSFAEARATTIESAPETVVETVASIDVAQPECEPEPAAVA
jgi:omega-6 fatty acid desaturase (delta-12 desaturase)